MTQQELIEASKKILPDYQCYMKESSPYQLKGIFHSELLMLLAIVEEIKPEQIIESGRARGQSTEYIARFCKDKKIIFHSIESNSQTVDVDIAEERLKDLPARLHYGNSFDLIPELINEKKTLVLIDGPKGSNMWRLFRESLCNKKVLGVFMHDSNKGSSIRANLDSEFSGKYLISDDNDFVEAFKFLDEECWAINPWGAYQKGSYIQGKVFNLGKSESYSGTLSFVENKR